MAKAKGEHDSQLKFFITQTVFGGPLQFELSMFHCICFYLEVVAHGVASKAIIIGKLNDKVIIFRTIANHGFAPSAIIWPTTSVRINFHSKWDKSH